MRAAEAIDGGRLRVAFYTDARSRGGAEVSLRTLLAHLPADVDATVVGIDQLVIDWVAEARPGTGTRLVPEVLGKSSLGPMLEHRRVLGELRPHVVHVNLNAMADARWAVLAATTLRGVRVVAVEHSPVPPAERSVMTIKRLGSHRLDAHVAVGDRAARTTERAVGLTPGSVRTIHNGVPDDVTIPPRAAGQSVVLGCLARLDPVKGLDVLLESVARLAGVRLIIVGDGPERAALETQVHRLGVQGRVELRPWDDHARWSLAEMDIFVLPSRNEGLPLSIIEAMLASRPVVASDVGSVREAVVDEETGFLVPAENVEALTRSLAVLVADPIARSRFGLAGRQRALDHFTAPRMAAAYGALYRELTGG